MNSKKAIKLKALSIALAATVCAYFTVFISCSEDRGGGAVHDPSKPVVLTSFMPDSGRISEMVLLDGSNFGTDTSRIRVFFNAKRARTLASSGTRILALVPRLPGDTCVVTVEIGGKQYTYDDFFRYKIEASVTTLAGDGTNALLTTSLDKSQLRPVYIGADKDYNIFVSIENNSGMLVKLNEAENSIVVLATNEQGMTPRFQPNAHPATGVIMLGAEGEGNRDRFLTLDPKAEWVPKMRFIKNWKLNRFSLPDKGNPEIHYHCLYCKADGYLYTRYTGGQIVRIDSKTWDAEIIYETKSGIAYGMAFHPVRTSELWIGYGHSQGELSNSLCMLDVLNPETTFKKLSGATNGGHRDGRMDQAQFYHIRQMNFDADGNLYVGDSGNHCIRKVDTDNMMVETIIGIPNKSGFKDGNKDEAMFKDPHGIATDPDGIIYVSDYSNNRVRRIAIE
ncbi:MAG: IPT/TIG domain-containing protein [Prevotellaceae bacterium]|jgi:hypothetical protein|nr:IPT/TIG domain-containing protein [Prevotellaceae bacterium]